MCLVKVYAKTSVDLTNKVGAYAYFMTDLLNGQLMKAKPFIKPIKTMVHADCMAMINALHILSRTALAPEIEHLEIITDSSKVIALLQDGKADKYCDESLKHWVEEVKPCFQSLQSMKFIHVSRKGTGPADNIQKLGVLEQMAERELVHVKELSH